MRSGSPAGPIDGGRFSVTAGVSSDFTNAGFDSYLVSADWRRYFRLGHRTAWALRGFGFYSGGDRPRRINIGGTIGLRGYPEFGYIVGSQACMFEPGASLPRPHPSHPRHALRRHGPARDPGGLLHRCREGRLPNGHRPRRDSAATGLASVWRSVHWPCSGSTWAGASPATPIGATAWIATSGTSDFVSFFFGHNY